MSSKQVTDLKDAMRRFHPGSRPNSIAALELGESYSEAVRFSGNNKSSSMSFLNDISNAKVKLKESMATARVRAIERTGHNYIVEMGQFFTACDDVVVVCVVTRTE